MNYIHIRDRPFQHSLTIYMHTFFFTNVALFYGDDNFVVANNEKI